MSKKQTKRSVQDAYDKKKAQALLDSRVPILCACKDKKLARRDLKKFRSCRCDTYGFDTLGTIISNWLLRYVADGSQMIERDDWDVIERHARAIQAYADAGPWDGVSDDRDERNAYLVKERDFRSAMFWLSENFSGLWW